MASEIDQLKQLFASKHFHVSEVWLQCCLEWFKEQHTGYTQQYLHEVVIQQWLDTDLCEIEVRSLPPNVSKEKKLTLNGNYALQVMYIKDISKSGLSQLKDMRDMYKLTRQVTDHEAEPTGSGKRVLNLHMTDGVQFINGFEYQMISVLNINLNPGIKVLLSGPLMIRNGEFLLKQNNVRILGGEVESLLISNAYENVLARQLGMPVNPNPGKLNTMPQSLTSNQTVVQTSVTQVSETGNKPIKNNKNNHNEVKDNVAAVKRIKKEVIVIESDEEELMMAQLDACMNETSNTLPRHKSYNPNDDLNIDDEMFTNINFEDSVNKNESRGFTSKKTQHKLESDSLDDEFLEVDITKIEEQFVKTNQQKINTATAKSRPTLSQEYFNFDIDDELAFMEGIENEIKVEIPVIDKVEPYVYIKQLIDNREKITSEKYTVKARFTRVIERMNVSKDRGWSMKFEISDGTANIVTVFLSDVLEEIMGLSPADALAEKLDVKQKKCTGFEKMTKALVLCKQKLKSFDGLIDLQFSQENEIATIVSMKQVTRLHLEQLMQRVDIASVKF